MWLPQRLIHTWNFGWLQRPDVSMECAEVVETWLRTKRHAYLMGVWMKSKQGENKTWTICVAISVRNNAYYVSELFL